jgi:hypothetical protein
MLEHGVGDGQEFTHQGDERDLGGFPSGEQALIESGERAIAAGRNERRHVERVAHGGAATDDPTLAPALATVLIHGSDADERGNGAAVQRAELRQFGQQGARDDGANARDTA